MSNTSTDMQEAPASFIGELSEQLTASDAKAGFRLIGIGASAGGLEALKAIVSNVPAAFPHSLVIVQHLSPEYKSMMREILDRETRLKVVKIEDNMKIEPGVIYVLPPSWNLMVTGNNPLDHKRPKQSGDSGSPDMGNLKFSLLSRDKNNKFQFPIDVFFKSLARATGELGAAIVLSGAGRDGSQGLRAIKERGGLCMAQSPETAAFDAMPLSAINTRLVDLICAPEDILKTVTRYFEADSQTDGSYLPDIDVNPEQFEAIVDKVGSALNVDFSKYKDGTLKRRMSRRMKLAECLSLEGYAKRLKSDPEELSLLGRDFLVGATSFFRDLPAWTDLETKILPELFASGDMTEPLKIWCLGCSTGEEAFTIALILAEYRRRNRITREFRIIASDVNSDVIDVARRGVYPKTVLDDFPPEYRTSDLLNVDEQSISFSSRITSHIVFSRHNALSDPPYIHTDLVICRNLMIYFRQKLQNQLLNVMSFSLKRDGFLFLGCAEGVTRDVSAFSPVIPSARIFRNTQRTTLDTVRRYLHKHLPVTPSTANLARAITRPDKPSSGLTSGMMRNLATRTDSCVLVMNGAGQVSQSFGEYRDYLELPANGFSSNILDLLPPEFSGYVALMIRQAARQNTVERRGVVYELRGEMRTVDIFIDYFDEPENDRCVTLTIVSAQTDVVLQDTHKPATPDESALVRQMKNELAEMRAMVATSAEDLGLANEEMQASNEELVTSNEELQASNEELQATNEELHSVNAESSSRILDLEAANDDIENLLNNAEFSILFLDTDLRIRRFSQGFVKYLELVPSDTGRRLSTFSSFLEDEDMRDLLKACKFVLKSGETYTRYVVLQDGARGYISVRRFFGQSNQTQGVVIKLLDLTELHELRELRVELEQQRNELERLIEAEAAGYWDWNLADGTETFSPRFKAMFGYEEGELDDSPETWRGLIHPDDLERMNNAYTGHILSDGAEPIDEEVRYVHKDGSIVWVICRGRVVKRDETGKPRRMMGVHIDITALKRREQEVREVRRFAFIAAHDLMQPANTIKNSLAMLQSDYPQLLEDGAGQMVEFADRSVERLRDRIRAVLDYSRSEERKPQFCDVPLGEVFEDILEDLGDQIDASGARITVANLPVAFGAKALLMQVAQNLIANAIKFRDPARICEINVAADLAGDGMVGVRVSDNGIGIDAGLRQEVFNLFSRLHAEEHYPGNGLGLSLCLRLVSQHGGQIWIEDGVDGGSAFVFTLRAGGLS